MGVVVRRDIDFLIITYPYIFHLYTSLLIFKLFFVLINF